MYKGGDRNNKYNYYNELLIRRWKGKGNEM